MRALGPGSVSSFLKIILDVIYVGLWIFVSLLSLFTLVALLFSFNPELLAQILPISDAVEAVSRDGPLFAGALFSGLGHDWPFLVGAALTVPAAIIAVNAGRALRRSQAAGQQVSTSGT